METKEQIMTASLLKHENFGNPISEKLSNYLRAHTSKDDRANVAITTGVGTSTIRNVVFRSNTLTEDNSKAIVELVKVAIENCQKSIGEESQAMKALKEILIEQ